MGIGWVGYEENGIEDLGFKKAKNAIIRFKPKDLVWVKNTAKKEYYICEIAENKDESISQTVFINLKAVFFCFTGIGYRCGVFSFI